jgi:hypothetical protein
VLDTERVAAAFERVENDSVWPVDPSDPDTLGR